MIVTVFFESDDFNADDVMKDPSEEGFKEKKDDLDRLFLVFCVDDLVLTTNSWYTILHYSP